MIISYQWLMNYLPEPLPLAELTSILTSVGLEVEGTEKVESVPGSLEGLLIGHVQDCMQHPNADRLKITTVDIGKPQLLKIVCGAANVAPGQKVVVAPVGTCIYPVNGEPIVIKKAKIRGEESQGMICAEDEIGLGNSHDGIMVLPDDTPIGIPAASFFKIPEADTAITIGLTPNRSDAMSHIGIARDVCAYLSHHRRKPYVVQLPVTSLQESPSESDFKVQIEAVDACPRYCGLSIQNIVVRDSPEWLQRRLRSIGVKPVNNVVDVTNFVLHEYGQPLHAFDADKIHRHSVTVRLAGKTETFLTLDGKERSLTREDLLIADDKEALCIAGVMGGKKSGVTDATKNVFLESACFDATYIRRTSTRLGLRTDAAVHFEKGVDIKALMPALHRAAALILEVAGGSVSSPILDVQVRAVDHKPISLSFDYLFRLSGKAYDKNEVAVILKALDFEVTGKSNETITVVPPTNKTDILQPADIVEEILRIDGLDNIPIPERLTIPLRNRMDAPRFLRQKMSALLMGNGFQEIVTNSIVNAARFPDRENLIRMLNSLSSELNCMRPSLLESGLEVINYNCNRKSTNLLLFELGQTYSTSAAGYSQQPHLALWATGDVRPLHWNQTAQPADLFFMKGIVNNLFRRAGVADLHTGVQDNRLLWYFKKDVLAEAFDVNEKKLSDFEVRQRVFFANIHWDVLLKATSRHQVFFKGIPRFPSVDRDLALVLDRKTTYKEVVEVTEAQKIDALKNLDVFDIFESEKLGSDKKQYALSFTFQLEERTLTDKDVDGWMRRLTDAYYTKLGAQIRE